jgi:hypothetical protein
MDNRSARAPAAEDWDVTANHKREKYPWLPMMAAMICSS